ncbi:MAG TPA: YidC/Oxa1 family membrane protein insertase [Candidatus Saccharimonadales bacterium]|nr:YidC/Oxa1 family membrane protein insertase [Candidatus Saccharimonadales bacterium]
MFTTLIVQPIFNLLVLIYALLPGHNFGMSLIIFTIVIRLLLWPLVKKQLHQAKAMKALQPEIKRVKQQSKGNRAKESQMLMELYKERGINPFATFPILIVQLIILIGLYSGLRKLIADPHAIFTFAYPALQQLSWMQHLAKDISQFDNTLFGIVDLSKPALSNGAIYWPAMIIVLGSAVAQYYQSKQLLPDSKDQRGLRSILKAASDGQPADQSEVNAAVGRSTRYLLPFMIFFFTVSIASALSLYWLVGGIVAYIQQSIVLNKDEAEMEEIADAPTKDLANIPEAEIVTKKSSSSGKKDKKTSSNSSKSSKRKSAKKRRKRR